LLPGHSTAGRPDFADKPIASMGEQLPCFPVMGQTTLPGQAERLCGPKTSATVPFVFFLSNSILIKVQTS
jgi:hypothetical protein